MVGLKTHCKVILVVRRTTHGLRRYLPYRHRQLPPGYRPLYTDLGLLTCDEDIGQDLTELFNYLTTGYTPNRSIARSCPRPYPEDAASRPIDREIARHTAQGDGLIQIKMNALEDAGDHPRPLQGAPVPGSRWTSSCATPAASAPG